MFSKPSVEEILELEEKCSTYYSELKKQFVDDETYYELAFKDKLGIPKQFENDRIILPTARDVVDTAVNHTDIINARIFVNKKGDSKEAEKSSDMLRKFALGLIHRTNVESSIAPGRVGAKHYWLHGLACYKTIWVADKWLDKPEQKEGESEEEYAVRLDEWRAMGHLSIPIAVIPVNPANVMPDPDTGGELYVIEKRKRTVFSAQKVYPHWRNENGKQMNEEIECISYWDKYYRCELVDKQPVLKIRGGVAKHKYDFIPYTLIESGLGNLSADALPEKRYVGLLRKIFDLLVSESMKYTLDSILMKRETMKGGYLTGADAAGLADEIKQEYGVYYPLGDKDVEFHDWEVKMPPQELYQSLALTHSYISGHAAPPSVRGMGEQGVRSGADRRLVIAQASSIYSYAAPAFANGWSNVLTKCARLVKNVIPGDFEIWARTPTDEFDIEVKKSLFKEPMTFYVEFSPVSEIDEFARHDDLRLLVQSGIVTPEWAREQMSNVDKKALERQIEKERIKASQAFQQFREQLLQQKVMEKLGIPPQPPGQQAEGQPQQGSERRVVPPIRQPASPGSTQEIQNQMGQIRSQVPAYPGQGEGGGGRR